MWHIAWLMHMAEYSCCRLVKFPVGILTPDWLANATYLGAETVDAKPCHVWTKADGFIKYWADQESGDPVRWIFFDGMQVGRILPEVHACSAGLSLMHACSGKWTNLQ